MRVLDPHQRPPESVRNVYKTYQKMKLHDLDSDPGIVDLSSGLSADLSGKVRVVNEVESERLTASFRVFAGHDCQPQSPEETSLIPVYEHEDMPGKLETVLETYRHMVSQQAPFECVIGLLPAFLNLAVNGPRSASQALTGGRPPYTPFFPAARDSAQATLPLASPRSFPSFASDKHPHLLQCLLSPFKFFLFLLVSKVYPCHRSSYRSLCASTFRGISAFE